MFNRVINFALNLAYRSHSYNIWLSTSTIVAPILVLHQAQILSSVAVFAYLPHCVCVWFSTVFTRV